MAEEETETKEPEVREVTKEVHVGMTEEQVDAKIRKLRDEYSELHASDKKEKEELKAEIAELKEHKEKMEKANEDRDKVKGSESTMVLPPSDIPPQQPNVGTQPPTHDQSGKKRSRWKSAW